MRNKGPLWGNGQDSLTYVITASCDHLILEGCSQIEYARERKNPARFHKRILDLHIIPFTN